MKVTLNGIVMDASKAVISVYDHGFLYGMGLFETFRTYGGKPFMLDRHLRRLMGSCQELAIRWEADAAVLNGWTQELLRQNELSDGYFRLTVSAGEAELGLPAEDYMNPNVLLLVKPLAALQPIVELPGKELRLLKTRRNTPEGAVRSKSLHYMNNIIAKRELLSCGASAGAEGLMLSEGGWLAEGIVSNLFFAVDGVIYTPAIETGILPGITRELVLELAEEDGFHVKEGLYSWEQLMRADEIWMTNSIQELVPVTLLTGLDGQTKAVGTGSAGEITKRLLSLYRKRAGAPL